jgi:ABC-type transport system substrate-binding protein
MYAGPTSFSDATLDDLLQRGRASFDQVERKQIYHQFEERLLELAPVAFMNWREQGFAGQEYVRGFQMITGVMGNISEIAYVHTWLDR